MRSLVVFMAGFMIGVGIILLGFYIYFSMEYEDKYQIIQDLIWTEKYKE